MSANKSNKRTFDRNKEQGIKKKYRSDGTPTWAKRVIDGPGVWVTCVKGKEKQAVGELYDLFEKVASEIWPELDAPDVDAADEDEDLEVDLEKQIAEEMSAMKRPRREQRFVNCQTSTTCVVFISCKAPIDPVELVLRHVQNVEDTGVTHTRYTQRLTPVIHTVAANEPEIKSLAQRALKHFFASNPERAYRYKVELRIRSHNTLSRQTILDTIVSCVPEDWTVDLEGAEAFILVEVFKSVAGISIVTGYYEKLKFNVMEIAKANGEDSDEDGKRIGARMEE
ncbi:hypothetical protein PENSPDRAFT_678111 [Peniophora sp. CONT]|nr:hypothetical protein PENSPDRAFT_678111 [Peniophora sp. CONT]